MQYFCCRPQRRQALAGHPAMNGIDFLEVLDGPTVTDSQRQRTLFLHFVNAVSSPLAPDNLRIDGGERIRQIAVTSVNATADPRVLAVVVNQPGDFSIYTLRLVADGQSAAPPDRYDPLSTTVDFSFKAACPNDFDCQVVRVCPPEPTPLPAIDYLAKDYGSFRRLMLDRLALLAPEWRERTSADLGIVLVELLAYVADYLSYRQDAIATEAYLGTARRRVSVRRHARLVNYPMHDGCNARVWVQLRVGADTVVPRGTQLLTRVAGAPRRIPPRSLAYEQAIQQGPEVFETMDDTARLYVEHNLLHFYTWGDQGCCLPAGATSAALRGRLPNLKPNDVLIFVERRGAVTGAEADADPARRHAVRLTDVTHTSDPLGGRFEQPPTDHAVPVTEIAWAAADALPVSFCVSSRSAELGSPVVVDVSVALGNVVLADHGRTIDDEQLGDVPRPALALVVPPAADRCQERPKQLVPGRFRPRLARGPLTQAATVLPAARSGGGAHSAARISNEERRSFDPSGPATDALRWEMADVLPAIAALLDPDGANWHVRRDLLGSSALDRHFVAEVEEDGLATLRFGDGVFAMRPRQEPDADKPRWRVTYRIGNGVRGNVGAESIAHVVFADSAVESVWNPMAAAGGLEPEGLEDVRQRAPVAFRTQERAVTLDDYAAVVQRHPDVQRAAASFRWTGSWRTVFVTVDRYGGREVDADFKAELRRYLERYRLAGQDVEIDGPRYVPLELGLRICLRSGYRLSAVKPTLESIFSSRRLPDGRRGLFHPDRFSFGQPVYLSPLVAAAQATPGVAFVAASTFQRWGLPSTDARAPGRLDLGRLEIARLDNDPSFPEHGVFRVELQE